MSSDSSLEQRLAHLQSIAAALDFGAAERAEQRERVVDYTESFLERVASLPVFLDGDGGADAQELAFSDEPTTIQDALDIIGRHIDNSGLNIGSSRFLAYIPGGGLYPSALADFLAAVSNRYASVQSASPGAARLEQRLVRWLADVVGYPEGAEGDLTSGGSIAALSAIVAARQAFEIKARDVERTVVYVTRLTHHTFLKALKIAGLGECVVHRVDLDSNYRLDVHALKLAVEKDRAAGLAPWMISASAGTTVLGTVDPLAACADIAEKYGLWLHVDGAYGAAFMLCEEGRQRLQGIERSHSLIMDPHKGFFLPYGTGGVLVREGQHLYNAYHARGTYQQDLSGPTPELDHSHHDYSPELSRSFRGLRLWLPFKLVGLAPFRAALEEKLLLAEYFHRELQSLDGFVPGPRPDLSIVGFRYRPDAPDTEALNRALADSIRDEREVCLSSTTLDGHFTHRVAVLSHNTHREDIDLVLELLVKHARQLTP